MATWYTTRRANVLRVYRWLEYLAVGGITGDVTFTSSVELSLGQMTASCIGEFTTVEESHYDLIPRLQFSGIVPREIGQIFGEIRRAGDAASHERVLEWLAARTIVLNPLPLHINTPEKFKALHATV